MVDDDPFRTIAGRATASLTISGSEFIGTIAPAVSTEDAADFIEDIEETYPDATHHVPAYRIRSDPFRAWASDDGEPGGSAGEPILNVLRGEGLENVVAVVTRYFGGTELGYGGLVSAYTETTKRCVDAATVVERRPTDTVRIESSYDDSGTVRGILESQGVEFAADYETSVTFTVRIPRVERAAVLERLRDATSGRIDVSRE